MPVQMLSFSKVARSQATPRYVCSPVEGQDFVSMQVPATVNDSHPTQKSLAVPLMDTEMVDGNPAHAGHAPQQQPAIIMLTG
jgi:hypothetical protein